MTKLISDFRSCVKVPTQNNIDSVLLGYDSQTLNNDRSWTSGPLTMKALHSFETSDTDNPVTQRHIPGDLSPHAHRQANRKTRIELHDCGKPYNMLRRI